MADGVAITAGSGTTIATDDAGAAGHVQVVKLAISADGSATAIPADATNGIDVDVTRLPALVAGTANIGDVDVLTVPAPLSTTGGGTEATAQRVTIANDSTGVLSVDDNGSSLTVDGTVTANAGTGTFTVAPVPTTTGLSVHRSLDVDESEEQVKATAGTVYGWYIANRSTATRYVKFYNATAANVTVGSTSPYMTLALPGDTVVSASNLLGGMGIAFDTAICVAATTGLTDADTGAPAANDIIANIFYQ